VQYLDDPAPVDKSHVLVMPMCAYDLVRGLPWFHKQNPDIDWARLTSLRSPSASGVEEMTPMTTAVASKVSQPDNDNHNVNDKLLGRSLGIQTLGATAFNDLLTSIEVVVAFARQTGECIGLLGATVEDITLDSPGNTDPCAGRDEQRAAAVVAAEELLRGDA